MTGNAGALAGVPPSQRFGHTAIFDPARDRMVVFGGWDGASLNDVWALSLAGSPGWTNVSTGGTPPGPRYQHSAIYDGARDKMIMLGGSGGGWLDDIDVWALALSTPPSWTHLSFTGTRPTERNWAAAACDAVRSRMVTFGGSDNAGYYNDVWAMSLSGSPAWTQITPTGTAPAARYMPTAVYDSARQRLVGFGGYAYGAYLGDVWALSLSGTPSWTTLTPAGTPPSLRYGHAAIYDPVRDRVVVFAGNNGSDLNDTWVLSLSGTPAWTKLTPAGTLPGARMKPSAIYDPVRDRMVVFGGRQGSGFLNDTWALSLSGTPTWTDLMAPLPDRAPVVTAPTTAQADGERTLTIDVTASDPDGDPITTLECNASSVLPWDADVQFVVKSIDPLTLGGTLTWTPECGEAWLCPVTFVARNALTGWATTQISLNWAPDTDADGLPDTWESTGVPIEGELSYRLPGADPHHKDLYVEVDAATGWAPTTADLQLVVDAFAASPVCNPDGTTGIRLHILGADCDPCVDDAGLSPSTWAAKPWPQIHDFKEDWFGTVAERADPDWPRLAKARARVVRYCVFGDEFGSNGNSGICEGTGQDFVVTLGSISDVDSEKRAGTFMHELGHSLGLGHGGGDGINGKPNYFSIMNYIWQWRVTVNGQGLDRNSAYRRSWRLDYSRSRLNELNEASLDENRGIGGDVNLVVPFGPPRDGAVFDWFMLTPMGGPVDWNGNNTDNEPSVRRDLNNFAWPTEPVVLDQLLSPFDDWNNLRYAPSEVFPPPVPSEPLLTSSIDAPEEMTQAIYDSLCSLHFDCNGNEIEDAEEIAAGTVADVNSNGIPDPCEALANFAAVGEKPLPRSGLSIVPVPGGTAHEIRYALPVRAQTRLRVFDLTGRVVATLADGDAQAGDHRVVWGHVDAGGHAVSSGVYFVELRSGDHRARGKIVVLR